MSRDIFHIFETLCSINWGFNRFLFSHKRMLHVICMIKSSQIKADWNSKLFPIEIKTILLSSALNISTISSWEQTSSIHSRSISPPLNSSANEFALLLIKSLSCHSIIMTKSYFILLKKLDASVWLTSTVSIIFAPTVMAAAAKICHFFFPIL